MVRNLNMRYRPETPLVLRNVSFELAPGEQARWGTGRGLVGGFRVAGTAHCMWSVKCVFTLIIECAPGQLACRRVGVQ